MPDLVTHISAAYIVRRGTKSIAQVAALFYLGVILPDLLTRPVNILLPPLYWFVMPLHTPLALVMVCLLLSYFFTETVRRKVFLSLIFGAYFHLVLDLFQKSIIPRREDTCIRAFAGDKPMRVVNQRILLLLCLT